tara:strand:+ start:208 stop:1185 length:978 start_codon:yes stop_codon:yes gene_type:complete
MKGEGFMFKYFLFSISIFSFLISDQVEHSYNSSVPSFTKTGDPGRVNIEVTNNNTQYRDAYIDDTSYGFNTLSDISGITYFGYEMNTIFQEAGLNQVDGTFDLTDFYFDYNTFAFNASYHGYNGMGYYLSYEMGQMEFPHSNLLQDSWNPTTSSITVGLYALWNEIYSTSSPAMVDGSQYTFPTTKILTGFYINRYHDLFDNYSSVVYMRIAMDFIISEKLNFSNRLDYDFSDDADVFMSIFTSKFIYDINNNVSIAASSSFQQDNQGDYLLSFLLEGGYQFNNLTYGYTKSNIKLAPYFKSNIGGKNKIYSSEEFGLKIHLFFN